MMNVARQQSTKRLRVLPRSSAAALVSEETDAINIRKDPGGTRGGCCLGGALIATTRPSPNQLTHERAVTIISATTRPVTAEPRLVRTSVPRGSDQRP